MLTRIPGGRRLDTGTFAEGDTNELKSHNALFIPTDHSLFALTLAIYVKAQTRVALEVVDSIYEEQQLGDKVDAALRMGLSATSTTECLSLS